MIRKSKALAVGVGLLVLHAAVLLAVGSDHPDWFFGLSQDRVGWILSDLLQLALGGLLICVSGYTARRTEGWYSRFWKLHALAFVLWSAGQAITVYLEAYPAASASASSYLVLTQNMLFCFWFIPLGLALFLDPGHETQGFDWLLALDFCQGVLASVAAYLYFFYLPRAQSPTDLSDAVWAPYFAGYGLMIAVFAVRGRLSHSRRMRSLFSRLAVILGASCAADALYYYGHVRVSVGAWFDLLWSFLLFSHLLLPRDLAEEQIPEGTLAPAQMEPPPHRFVGLQLSPLLLAVCTLAMSAEIAREKLGVATVVVVLSFVLFGARHLVTHYRLLAVQEALRREAMHDGLTGLWRHNAILEILERELLRAQRTNEPVSVIMTDLDHFKLVNDRLGHAAGDAVLRRVARELDDAVRPYDSVGRYGGEEFLIVAPACGVEAASALAERIRARVAGMSIAFHGVPHPVTISLGVVTQASGDSEELLLLADRALYQAKAHGRNRVEMATRDSTREPIPGEG